MNLMKTKFMNETVNLDRSLRSRSIARDGGFSETSNLITNLTVARTRGLKHLSTLTILSFAFRLRRCCIPYGIIHQDRKRKTRRYQNEGVDPLEIASVSRNVSPTSNHTPHPIAPVSVGVDTCASELQTRWQLSRLNRRAVADAQTFRHSLHPSRDARKYKV